MECICAHLQEAVQEVYQRHVGRYCPARSDVVVRKLPVNAKVEVESFAVKKAGHNPRLQVCLYTHAS